MASSYDRGSPQLNRTMGNSRNTTSTSHPQITSTPLNSLGMTRTTGSLVTPTRRFLGPRRYALSSNGNLSPMKMVKDPPGPLLTNANYNVNVSTYIDTKSPGITGRLVQYNEENARSMQHTHQEKYGSPGLFPIIHLFKKDVPVISPKPKKITVRIGTPDLKSQYSKEHNRLLLEGIVCNNSLIKGNDHDNEDSTRSVLDALKEISRKRIHAGEEYEVSDEANKKLRRESLNGDGDSSKRNRMDSPTSESSVSPPSRQPTKKLRTIDAVLASKTSSMYANYDTGTKRKTVEDAKVKVSPLNKKKYSDAETQTKIANSVQNKDSEEEKKSKVPESKQVITTCTSEESIPQPPKQVLKIFDDKPLEIIRKNRLGALLSALTGHKIPPIPMEDRRKALDKDWLPQTSDKKLTGILSPLDRQTKLKNKHVTFNIPDNSNSSQADNSNSLTQINHDSIVKNSKDAEKSSESTKNSDEQPQTSNIETAEAKIINQNSDMKRSENQSSSVAVLERTDNETRSPTINKQTVGGFKFDLNKPITSPNQSNLLTPSSKPKDIPQSNFPSSTVTTTPTFSMSPSFFPKFETQTSKTIDSSQLTSKLSSPNHLPKNTSSSPINSLGLPASLPQVSTNNSFGEKSSPNPITFGKSQKSELLDSDKNEKSAPVFAFGNNEAGSTSSNNTFPDLKNIQKPDDISKLTVPSTVSTGGTFSFNASKLSVTSNTSNSSPNLSTTTSSKLSSFSGMKTPALGSTITSSTTSMSKNLFNATNSNSVLGMPLGTNVSSPKFGNTATSSTNSSTFKFNSSSCNAPVVTSSSSLAAFSIKTNFSSTNAPVGPIDFNSKPANSKVPTSTTDSLSSSMKLNTSVFGNSSENCGNNPPVNNKFGVESKSFAFGSPSTNTTFSLGGSKITSTPASISFGTSSTSNVSFGTSTSNVPFGTTSNAFAPPSNNMFSGGITFSQTNPTPSFGVNVAPSFGATTTTTTSFGSSNVSSFTTSNTNISAFDKTNSGAFGAPNTTASSIFGSNNNQSFGVTSNNSSGFGSSSSFGNANTTTSLTFGTNTPTFGTSTTSSVFGTINSPTFGNSSSTPAFGSANTPSFGNVSTPFGTANTPAFGTTNTTFSTTNTPSFGTTNTPSFGTTNAPSFGTTSTPSFGSTNTQTFGSSNVPSFGSTKPPSFGSTNSFSVPPFGTAAAMFGNPITTASAPFGNTVITTSTALPNTFNSSSTMAPFGSSNGTNSFTAFGSTSSPFNSATTTASFGTSSTNAFSTSNPTNNAFGVTPNNNAFAFGGSANNNAIGGGINTPGKNTFGSAFGSTSSKPEQNSNIFPTPTNSFGNSNYNFSQNNSNNNNNTGSGVFAFGSPNAQPSVSTGVFAFGGTEAPKTFSFSAPGTSTTGQAPSNMFPSTASFGQQNSTMPNMFSIGSGNSTQNRSRPIARAKKRTT